MIFDYLLLPDIVTKSTERRQRKNYEDFVLIWLHAGISDTEYCNQNVFADFETIVNRLEIFVNADECVDYATDIQDEKLLLIVSSSFAKTLVPLIHEISQIESLYVLSTSEVEQDDEWTKSFKKIKAICKDLSSIISQLQVNRKRSINDLLSVNILSTDPIKNTSSEEVFFMYSQIINDILFNFLPTKQNKQEIIEFCKSVYSDNQSQLRVIDEFEKTYTEDQAFWWYSRDTFVYRLINKALRIQDTNALFKLRFFIADLSSQIMENHGCSSPTNVTNYEEILTVYRGFGMANDDFDKLKNKTDGFMFITHFLSTSRDRNVAYGFAFPYTEVPHQVAILFEIKVRIHYGGYLCADIQKSSERPDEDEVLFSSGITFRIHAVTPDTTGVWIVQLTVDEGENQELRTLFPYLRLSINHTDNVLSNWAKCMLEMGYYDQAEQCYLLALEDSAIMENLYILSQIHNDLGFVYKRKGQTKQAFQHHRKALENFCVCVSPSHEDSNYLLVSILIQLGVSYCDQNDYDRALKCFDEAILLEEKQVRASLNNIATCYCNIGVVYRKQQRYSEALEISEKALNIKLQIIPLNHPDIAIVYNHISQIYYAQNNYDKAIEYLKQTLTIRQNSILPAHPLLGETYHNLSKALYEQHKYEEALECMNKAYDICLSYFSADHTHVIADKEWITQLQKLINKNSK